MLVLVFSKAFDRVPNIQFTREATPRWHQGIPNSRSHTSFLAEPSVAVDLRVVFRKHACLKGGGGPVCVSSGALAISAIYSVCARYSKHL